LNHSKSNLMHPKNTRVKRLIQDTVYPMIIPSKYAISDKTIRDYIFGHPDDWVAETQLEISATKVKTKRYKILDEWA